MGFAKLDSGIIRSSIWFEPVTTRVLWITMLAIKDENGFVGSSRKGLIQAANITEEEFNTAIQCLESPDPDSRTPDFDGRRVEKIDGGWIILNNEKYKLHSDITREKNRERVKRFRENHRLTKDVTVCNVTPALPSLSVSLSSSNSSSEEVHKETPYIIIPDHLKEIWPDFLKMRRAIRKPATDRAQKNLFSDLETFAPGDHSKQIKIVEQSITNSWQGFFQLRENFVSGGVKKGFDEEAYKRKHGMI